VSRENGEWIVHTEKGDIRCEIVVNAAGYYAQRVGEWFKPFGGRTVPMMVMSHQYLIFDEVPAVRDWSEEVGHKLPLLRDVDVSYYLRQEKNGFNLGPYERPCKAHWADPSDPLPEDFSFQLYPDALDRLSVQIEDSMARVPVLAEAGLAKTINGPIPYAPDGNPLLGPMPGVPNAFEACVFTFGIAQGGGAGKVLAEWITEGQTEWDMWSCDPRRFTDYTDHDYCVAKGMEVYGHEYGMHFPWHRWPAAPDRKTSPVHDRVKELGRPDGRLCRVGTRQLVRRAGRRHIRGNDPDLEPRRPLGAAHPRGMRSGARRCRRARPARLFALPPDRAGRAEWLWARSRAGCRNRAASRWPISRTSAAASSPRCRCLQRRGRLHADHRRDGAMA
jgi:hypothetical protein